MYSVNGILQIFRVPEYSEYLLRTGFVLAFHWEELGILKRGEKVPLRVVGLAQCTGRIRCLNLRQRTPFLECKSRRGQDARLRDDSQNERKSNILLQRRPIWLAGIFRVKQLRAPGFISVGPRQEPTTRNIPELGISENKAR